MQLVASVFRCGAYLNMIINRLMHCIGSVTMPASVCAKTREAKKRLGFAEGFAKVVLATVPSQVQPAVAKLS